MNHGCLSDVWLITWSMITFSPSRCASVIILSKSSSVPNIGSTSQ